VYNVAADREAVVSLAALVDQRQHESNLGAQIFVVGERSIGKDHQFGCRQVNGYVS
jgi:hypothetical protein